MAELPKNLEGMYFLQITHDSEKGLQPRRQGRIARDLGNKYYVCSHFDWIVGGITHYSIHRINTLTQEHWIFFDDLEHMEVWLANHPLRD
jgi:hypothetical protein